MQIHVVKSGETLWEIANAYQSDLNQIISVNQIDNPSVLVPGESIVIPNPTNEYVVQRGDTLASIAEGFGVNVEELARFNNITNPSLLYKGELIRSPYTIHTVKQGETLWNISQHYGVPINQLMQLNQIPNPSQLMIGIKIGIPNQLNPLTEVNAYTTQINQAGREEVLALGSNFTYLSPFMYSVKEDGSLTSMQEEGIIDAALANQAAPLLVLTNFKNRTFDSDLAALVLRDASIQEKLITHVIDLMKKKKYRGINIDFEYVYPEDRENYNSFLRRLVTRLHPEGLLVTTAVAPKESADQEGLLYEAHDYKAHGEIVDFVIVMTYEWGWAGGEPWAIAPINKVRDVLNYAVTVIPRDKIMMGVPLYGRDWKIPWQQGTIARTVSPVEAVDLAAKFGATIDYNEVYQSPFFTYTDNEGQAHEVWFEDARSMRAKYDTIKEYGLRGMSYWVLGSPFPQNWPVLRNHFRVKKV